MPEDFMTEAHGSGPQGNVAGELVDVVDKFVSAFSKGGLFEVYKQSGGKPPQWMEHIGWLVNHPDFNTAIGMGRYSPEQIDELRKLLTVRKMTLGQAAQQLGMTRGAVAGLADRLGISSGRSRLDKTPEGLQRLSDLGRVSPTNFRNLNPQQHAEASAAGGAAGRKLDIDPYSPEEKASRSLFKGVKTETERPVGMPTFALPEMPSEEDVKAGEELQRMMQPKE